MPRQREPAHQNGGVRQIVLERLLDARVLHLHHHFAAVAQPRGVDLAERCRRHRLPLEVREQLVGMPPELRLDEVGDLRELHPLRCLRQQLCHHAPRFFRQRVRVHRERLAELERRALELAEGGEDPLPRLAKVVMGNVRARELAPCVRREEISSGPRRQVGEPAEPPQPARGYVFIVGHLLAA